MYKQVKYTAKQAGQQGTECANSCPRSKYLCYYDKTIVLVKHKEKIKDLKLNWKTETFLTGKKENSTVINLPLE